MSSKPIPSKPYDTVSMKKLPKSEIEITGAISAGVFDSFRKKALENINQSIEMDGFRKGNIPEKVLAAKVGEKTILEEMSELALSEAYAAIIADEKLDPIGHPRIQITKMAMGNPLEFVLTTALIPDIILGDYKKVSKETMAKKIDIAEVTEKEIADAIERIKKSHEKKHGHAEHVGHDHDHVGHDHAGSDHTHPDLKTDTPEFQKTVREALTEDKKREAREKIRLEMIENIGKISTIELPAIVTESETARIEKQFIDDLSRMNIELDDYLVKINKTLDEMRAEWKPHAEKKARFQIILNKISDAEKIVPSEKEIDTEVAHIMEHYKDADTNRARTYASGVLTNEKVFEFLEAQK